MSLWCSKYKEQGYHLPVRVFSEAKALEYRHALESIENQYKDNAELKKLATSQANSLLPFVDEITRSTVIIDHVKEILGPNLLVWNASFFIKEPQTTDFISWHQDLTYWGLTDSHEVTAWVALTPATEKNGCMKFIPGTHKQSIVEHRDTFNESNLLSRGQELAVEVNEDDAALVILKPGEMSLHHGQLFHGSNSNQSKDRRIGLAIRYITPAMQQTIDQKTHAHLVAGEDQYQNFDLQAAPTTAMQASDIEAVKQNIKIKEQFLMAGVQNR